MNRNGQKPNDLNDTGVPVVVESKDLLDQENITRFDRTKKKKKKGGNTPASAPQPSAKQSGERRQQSEDRRQQKMAHKAQNMSQEAKKPQNKPRGNRHKPNNVRNSTNGQ